MRPKISGFTIVRNGIKFDYPFIESINSILPIVDEMIVSVGKSEDDSLDSVKKISSAKLKIIETVWDDSNRQRGHEFARQTNIALSECKFDWAFYLQADEVIHEDDLPIMEKLVDKYQADTDLDAFSLRYIHFEANYDYYNPFRYRSQVRLIRNKSGIVSIKDAAEFGRENGEPLRIKKSGARIFHYGWVKSPKVMLAKSKEFEKFWHSDEYVISKYAEMSEFDFQMLEVSKRFRGTHPAVMKERVDNWNIPLPRKVPQRPLVLRARTWHILLRKWGICKGEWF